MTVDIETLARMIHKDYNAKQLKRNPGQQLEFPTWEDLPDTLKKSNIRQAEAIQEKLHLIHCKISEPQGGQDAYCFTEEDVERMAHFEHDLWMEERLKDGWTYAAEKNVDLKQSPYLVPYDELTEEIKELDRDTVRIIPELLESAGLCAYRMD